MVQFPAPVSFALALSVLLLYLSQTLARPTPSSSDASGFTHDIQHTHHKVHDKRTLPVSLLGQAYRIRGHSTPDSQSGPSAGQGGMPAPGPVLDWARGTEPLLLRPRGPSPTSEYAAAANAASRVYELSGEQKHAPEVEPESKTEPGGTDQDQNQAGDGELRRGSSIGRRRHGISSSSGMDRARDTREALRGKQLTRAGADPKSRAQRSRDEHYDALR